MNLSAMERVRNVIEGKKVDRIPLCFWHHFRKVKTGEQLAESTYNFFVKKYNLDIIKIMPDLPYPQADSSISNISEFLKVQSLDLSTPVFQEQLLCIKILRSKIGSDYPILLTLFSPLSYAFKFVGKEKAIEMARKNPLEFIKCLDIISENLSLLIRAAIDSGADGIFFSCMGAVSSEFTKQEYVKFGFPFDILTLKSAEGGWLNTVHIHASPEQKGENLYFELFRQYPVSAISWSATVTGPSIGQARKITDKCLMTGINERGPIISGDKNAIKNEILNSTEHNKLLTKLILANGCSIPDNSPVELLEFTNNYAKHLNAYA